MRPLRARRHTSGDLEGRKERPPGLLKPVGWYPEAPDHPPAPSLTGRHALGGKGQGGGHPALRPRSECAKLVAGSSVTYTFEPLFRNPIGGMVHA